MWTRTVDKTQFKRAPCVNIRANRTKGDREKKSIKNINEEQNEEKASITFANYAVGIMCALKCAQVEMKRVCCWLSIYHLIQQQQRNET